MGNIIPLLNESPDVPPGLTEGDGYAWTLVVSDVNGSRCCRWLAAGVVRVKEPVVVFWRLLGHRG